MKFSAVTILQGVEFSIFPIDFEWALQQCSATALPVMLTDAGSLSLYVCIVLKTLILRFKHFQCQTQIDLHSLLPIMLTM